MENYERKFCLHFLKTGAYSFILQKFNYLLCLLIQRKDTLFDIHCLVAESDNDWSKAVCFGYFRRKDDQGTKRSLQWLVDCTRRIRVEHFPTCLSNCQSTLVRSPGCCTSLSKITYRDIRSWRATGIAVLLSNAEINVILRRKEMKKNKVNSLCIMLWYYCTLLYSHFFRFRIWCVSIITWNCRNEFYCPSI